MDPSGVRQPDAPSTYPLYEQRQLSYASSARPPSRDYGRPDLPRPLEPRPSYQLQTSLSDTTAAHSRQDPMSAHSAARAQRQNLPGLRDLFNPRSQDAGSPVYASSYAPSPTSATSHHQRQDSYPRPTLHPPLALHPPQDSRQQYQSPHDSRGPSTLQTSAASRYAPHPARPQFHPNLDTSREYTQPAYGKSRQESSASFHSRGDSSPYATGGAEARPYGYSTHDPSTPGSVYPPGTENQGKYLGIREFSGEGTFHLYEGGMRIPTHVDGEQVNPAWGLTKANKPRKRLAIACLDCREKKIKCEPGVTSCIQCEKAKRPCRRPQIQASQAESTPSATWSSASSPPRTHGSSDPTPSTTQVQDFDGSGKRRQMDNTSPTEASTKKHRSASPSLGSPTPRRAEAAADQVSTQSQEPVKAAMWQQHGLDWDVDPYAVDPETTCYLLDIYFINVNSAIYCMFPRRAFMDWVRTATHKCQNELMVLYGMLATGSIFADEGFRSFGKQCFRILSNAVASKHGKLNTLLAQARLLLCLCSFAKGDEGAAWDYTGGAIRTACGLQLHTEDGCLDGLREDSKPHWEFHFSKEQAAECRRRTFWSIYLLDRFAILLGCGTQTFIHGDDIFLRLPCADESYERKLPSEAPYYNNGLTDPTRSILTPASPVAPMAWLALGAVIWGDVMAFYYRAANRPGDTYSQAYHVFYTEMENALRGWLSRLPEHLQYRESNLERAVQNGYASCFVAIHTLHHYTMMRLNRWARHTLIPEFMPRNIRVAHYHAQRHLQMIRDVHAVRKEVMTTKGGTQLAYSLSTSFTGHATLAAIDIVAAGGLDQHLRSAFEATDAGVSSLYELSRYWNSGILQHRAAQTRLFQLQNIIQRPQGSKIGCWLGRQWGIDKPIEQSSSLDDDCIYGVEAAVYFAAFEDGAQQTQRPPSGSVRIA